MPNWSGQDSDPNAAPWPQAELHIAADAADVGKLDTMYFIYDGTPTARYSGPSHVYSVIDRRPDDADYFKMTLAAGRSYDFNMDTINFGDATLTIVSGNGTALASRTAYGPDVHTDFAAPATGNYFIAVSGHPAPSGDQSYTLTVQATTSMDRTWGG